MLYDCYWTIFCVVIPTTTHLTFGNINLAKDTVLQGLSRHEARAEAAPGRVGRGEDGEARPGNSSPRGGPQLELYRRRLKTWSKSGLSIAETTGPAFLYMYLPGGFCCGGLPPALASRMPVIFEDV